MVFQKYVPPSPPWYRGPMVRFVTDEAPRGQTKLQSAVETAASTAVGFAISWAATLVVLPWFGHRPTVADGFGITVFFTIISLVRGYALRRVFNHLHKERA